MTEPILRILENHPEYLRLREALQRGEGPVSVFGLGEGNKGHVAAALAESTGMPLLVVEPNEVSAARFADDFPGKALHFPARELLLSGKSYAVSDSLQARRVAVLSALAEGAKPVLAVSIEALLQRVAPPEAFAAATGSVTPGNVIQPMALVRELVAAGYERTEQCEDRGQVCLRGGYVDVFPVNAENPVRIEFFDEEVDTLRSYDPLTQRSIETLSGVVIPPATELPLDDGARRRGLAAMEGRPNLAEESERIRAGGGPKNPAALLPFFYPEECTLLSYLSGAIILLDEPSRIEESAKVVYGEFLETLSSLIRAGEAENEQAALMFSPLETITTLGTRRTAVLSALNRTYGLIAPKAVYRFETRPISSYVGREDLLVEDIAAWRRAGASVLLYAGPHAQRMQDGLADAGVIAPVKERLDREIVKGELLILGEGLSRGMEYPELSLAVITERELYGADVKRPEGKRRKRPQLAFSELGEGDLVVHELYGIGRFKGIETLTVGGVQKDYLHLIYAGGDKLYIPTDQLDRVQKYIGGEEADTRLSKLGSGEWQKTVSKTRESVKKLAIDLAKLYGERKKQKGFQFAPDNAWQRRMEESFPYEETPDQLTCIAQIKEDMESGKVMDRLLCGDVGYGKTEVALRAAFKAVLSGKQVAILVPTTILAQQHYSTIAARFTGFPVNVEILSRFKNDKEQKVIIEGLKKGAVDVVVGTHKLLSPSVKFKDLGLLVVDEEQRFGVGHKEQIKNIKQNVDVLTLSATPIPRTLHMSMTRIRDMSVIETPPAQRYPVQTYVMEYSSAIVREAILKELGRGGQVYFVYNQVRKMEHFAGTLRELVPEARIAFAHGQMNERVLEKTMLEFMDKQYDVLLCSTIIESGLDIQNVNTIIVYDADTMGLSQLYQLRGRVGRGVRLGYAYLMFRRDKVLNENAEKRLTAIREMTQFGSGFKIAMRDLEIRGAGNILGPEQHGHMAAVGYDFYCKIVDSAVKEAQGEPVRKEVDTVMDVPIPASIPKKYIPRESDRLAMYKRIAMIGDKADLYDVQDELIDRYGEIPAEVENLLYIALLKVDASRAWVSQLLVKDGEARLTFQPDAPMDGGKLLQAAHKIPGAQFLFNAEAPALVIRKKAEVKDFLGELPQIVNMLCDCIDVQSCYNESRQKSDAVREMEKT